MLYCAREVASGVVLPPVSPTTPIPKGHASSGGLLFWAVGRANEDDVHVWPTIGRHTLAANCWCHPDYDGSIWIHNLAQ
jgi:hypothetical protein